jgi:hypothetical protein
VRVGFGTRVFLKSHNLLIPLNLKNVQIVPSADLRYTAGTQTLSEETEVGYETTRACAYLRVSTTSKTKRGEAVALDFHVARMLGLGCIDAGAEPDKRFSKAWRSPEKAGWIRVHLKGSPSEIGYQHGYLLASEIGDARRVAELDLAWRMRGRTERGWAGR